MALQQSVAARALESGLRKYTQSGAGASEDVVRGIQGMCRGWALPGMQPDQLHDFCEVNAVSRHLI